MPAPMPPMGKATRLSRSPEYSPRYLGFEPEGLGGFLGFGAAASAPLEDASAAPTAVAAQAVRASRRVIGVELSLSMSSTSSPNGIETWHSRPRLCKWPGTAEGGCATPEDSG